MKKGSAELWEPNPAFQAMQILLPFWQAFLNLLFAKPMVCTRVAFHENDRNHENNETTEDNSDSYKQGVECWIGGNHGNHRKDENHGNPGCKPRGLDTLPWSCREQAEKCQPEAFLTEVSIFELPCGHGHPRLSGSHRSTHIASDSRMVSEYCSGCVSRVGLSTTIGPIRITPLISQQLSGVTEVKFIMPMNSLRIFWCNRWCAPS